MKFPIGLLVISFTIFDIRVTVCQLKLHPPWITVVKHVNETYMVKCEGDGDKVWRHGNDQIIDSNRAGQAATTISKKMNDNILFLIFNNIRKESRGFYNCSTNGKSKRYNTGFELIVVKPVIFVNTNFQESVTHGEGDDIIINCLTDGEPPALISWLFNDELISEKNGARLQSNNSLKISNASWRNSGKYTCRAFQKILQNRNAELVHHVKIRHKPMFYPGQTKTIIHGFRETNTNLTCRVHAHPEAYFIWYRDNKPIEPRNYGFKIFNEENTSILEVPFLDSNLGIYNCEAANMVGVSFHTFDLRLIEKPITPRLLIHEYSDLGVVISIIMEPYPTYPFVCHLECTQYTYCSFKEKWKRGFSLECKNERVKDTNKTSCKIDNLKPSTKYAVRAAITNIGGPGNFSRELIFRTRKEMPMLFGSSSSIIARYNSLFLSSNLVFVYLVWNFLKENNNLVITLHSF